MIYVILDKDNYVIDCLTYSYKEYIPVNVECPPNITSGCYRLTNGVLKLDDERYAEFIKPRPEPEPPTPPEPEPPDDIEERVIDLEGAFDILLEGLS